MVPDYSTTVFKPKCVLTQMNTLCTWPMCGKTKSKCDLGVLKVNKLIHSYPNVMKLENYGPTRECLNNNHQTTHKSCTFQFFTITLKIQKVQKWQTPFWNPH